MSPLLAAPVLRPPQGSLGRIRWFFLLFSFFFIVTYLPQVTVQSPRPLGLRAAAVVVLVCLGLWWLRCYRRAAFPLLGLPLEAAAFVLAGLAADDAFKSLGLLYIAVNFRNLYEGTWRAVVFTATAIGCFLTSVLLAPLLGGPDQLGQFLQAAPGVPVLAVITHLMGRSMSRGERAAVRERALATAGTALAAARDRAGFDRAAVQAVHALLGHPAGVTAAVRPGPAPAAAPRRTVLPLAGRSGVLAHLVVDLAEGEVPTEARDALEALAGTAALVLANIALTEDLRARAERDGLTGLVNCTELHARLGASVARAESAGPSSTSSVSVVMVDLDGFKAVNDSAGHAAGDAVLRAVSARLRQEVRGSDVVGRVGGDEFVVVLEHPAAAVDQLGALADRLLRALGAPVDLEDGRQAHVGASIGVATRVPGEGAAQLLARADASMYEAKRAGRGRVRGVPAPEPALR